MRWVPTPNRQVARELVIHSWGYRQARDGVPGTGEALVCLWLDPHTGVQALVQVERYSPDWTGDGNVTTCGAGGAVPPDNLRCVSPVELVPPFNQDDIDIPGGAVAATEPQDIFIGPPVMVGIKEERMSSLGEEYPKEQARCRELLGMYKGIGAPGAFGALTIEAILKRADKAVIEGDLPAMLVCFKEMKGCE